MIYILARFAITKKTQNAQKGKIKHLDLYELATEIRWFEFFSLKWKC